MPVALPAPLNSLTTISFAGNSEESYLSRFIKSNSLSVGTVIVTPPFNDASLLRKLPVV